MESAERRASYAANRCFTHDFMMRPNSSDHPSSVSKTLESDLASCNSVNDQANSGQMHPSREKLPDMKWWLHVKSNLGEEANYTCQRLNSWEGELDSYCAGLVDGNVKTGDIQSFKHIDSVSCIGSANRTVEQPWNGTNTCVKNNNSRMSKIEAALNNDLQLTAKKKDQGEFWFKDDHFGDWDLTEFLTSEQCKMAASNLDSQWIGTEKIGPWWRNAGKDELASLVAQKSLEHIENCDLPQPQIKHSRTTPSPYLECLDHDKKTLPSYLNEKAQKGSFYVESYTSGTPTSGCSSQDSDRLFSSNHSKDSYSTSKGEPMNSESKSKAQLLEALCHSQTRAREAEKAAQQAYNEKEHILSLFFRQASQLFAYKQWLHLLQLENLCLQLRNKNQPLLSLLPASRMKQQQLKNGHRVSRKRKSSNRGNGIRRCAVAFAVGLGLAGAGLLLGWTMGWMFPPIQI